MVFLFIGSDGQNWAEELGSRLVPNGCQWKRFVVCLREKELKRLFSVRDEVNEDILFRFILNPKFLFSKQVKFPHKNEYLTYLIKEYN